MKSKERIVALNDWYEKNNQKRNEATTRLHLIDSLFFECLGWGAIDPIEIWETMDDWHGRKNSDLG